MGYVTWDIPPEPSIITPKATARVIMPMPMATPVPTARDTLRLSFRCLRNASDTIASPAYDAASNPPLATGSSPLPASGRRRAGTDTGIAKMTRIVIDAITTPKKMKQTRAIASMPR